ncbi:MAG: thioredoxin family protein [Leptospiraceae bacterium]|nr:thioredoxin family protein [Leptospiraceae bacterium]
MIRFIPIFLTLFFSHSVFCETKWLNSLDAALTKAQEENKPIVLDLYTDWCGYCKVLEEKIFPAKDVASEIEKFIAVRINGDEFPDLVTKFSVRGYPTIILLDKTGYFIDKITGLPDNTLLITKLQEAYIKKDIEGGLLAEQKQSPDSVLPNYNLGLFYYRNGNFKNSSEYFLKSYNATSLEDQDKKPEALFFLGLVQIQEKKFQEAISIWDTYIEKYPENRKGTIFYCRGISNYFSGKRKEAKEDLLKAKELSPNKEQLEKIETFLAELET